MIGGAVKLATLPLRRRLIGAGIMLIGVLLVLLGFFVDIGKGPASTGIVAPVQQLDSDTAAGILRHAFDHPLFGPNGVHLPDIAFRGGVVLMAGAAAVALLTVLLPPLRGFAGLFAGLGLLGDAAIAGVLFGQNTRLSIDFGHNPSIHINLGAAVPVLAAGFAVILVGGALAAWRPLAGLFSGISLALTGAGLGAVLAIMVGGSRFVGAVTGSH